MNIGDVSSGRLARREMEKMGARFAPPGHAMKQVPLPDVPLEDLRIVRLLVQTAAQVLHRKLGRWPTVTEVLAFISQALFLDLDAPVPYCEAVRWLAAGEQDATADDGYGVVVFDPGPAMPHRLVVPSRVAAEVEAWLQQQP